MKKISLTRRLPIGVKPSPSSINGAIAEIESVLNRMGVCRFVIDNPQKDYFLFDKDGGKLYLKTIEGDTKELKFNV